MAAPSPIVQMQLVVSGDHMPSPWVPTASKTLKDKSFIAISSQDKKLRQAAGCSNRPTRFFIDLMKQRNEATAQHVRQALKTRNPQHVAIADQEMDTASPNDNPSPPAKRIRARECQSVLDDEHVVLFIKLRGLGMHVLASIRADASVYVMLEETSIKNLLKAMLLYHTPDDDPHPATCVRATASLVNFEEIACPQVLPKPFFNWRHVLYVCSL